MGSLGRVAVPVHEFLPDRDAEAGAVRDGDLAIDDGEGFLDEAVEQGIEAKGVLQDRAAWAGGGEVQAGGEDKRRAPEVRVGYLLTPGMNAWATIGRPSATTVVGGR